MENIHMKKTDAKIAGSGQIGGGNYNDVKISGSGKVAGDITCSLLSISGSGKVEGNTVAEKVHVSGSAKTVGNIETGYFKASGSMKIEGDLRADEAKASGTLKIEKDAHVKKFDVSGSVAILGSLYGEVVECSGDLKVNGNVEVEKFDVHGALRTDGTLNVGELNIRLHGESRAKEVGGEKITIKPSGLTSNFIMKMVKSLFLSTQRFVTDVIEGDEIYLEDTEAKIVRGNKIIIGKGCTIGTVEYRDSLEVVGGGKVDQEKKV
jgi:cytoskeletal protein CcmA (bactofilin family)